jgi:hypothetical protein
LVVVVETEYASQVTNCRETSELGSHLQIHLKITPLLVELVIVEQHNGSSRAAFSMNGCNGLPFVCLWNAYVFFLDRPFIVIADGHWLPDLVAGSGKTIFLYV